jgi:putative SOS response-associated peptidase YedK
MCARFTLTARPELISQLFDLDLLLDIHPRFNVAPTQNILAVRSNEEGNREFVELRWGLIPSWATDSSIGNKLLNARSETIAEKPSFRSAIRKRRCLIAADGFYEWKTEHRQKQPYFIHFPNRTPFAFAGVWERWHADDGKPVETCSILTTEANERLKPLHDRMPVILSKKDYPLWLDTHITDAAEVQPLLQALPADALELYTVTPKVNNARFDEPEFVEPLNQEPLPKPKQASLFDE